jgi:hypothetical protein
VTLGLGQSPEMQQHTAVSRAVESELEGILGGVGVRKNVPTPTLTSI